MKSLVFCRDCRRCFHPHCWKIYEDHTSNTSQDEPCQAFSRLDVHLWMKHLHNPRTDQNELMEQLRRDRPHRWIGIRIDSPRKQDMSAPKLVMYSALTKQFTNVHSMPLRQFPRLISFFGDSGKGKSTIVQNLIRSIAYTKAKDFDTPVVSTLMKSTSGGIHVYCDPETFHEVRPIVYAGRYNGRAFRCDSNVL